MKIFSDFIKLVPQLPIERILYSISFFIIGGILSIVISKITKSTLKRISKRTRTELDDFIFGSIIKIIKPIGFLLSLYFAVDYFFIEDIKFESVLLNLQKLVILIINIDII